MTWLKNENVRKIPGKYENDRIVLTFPTFLDSGQFSDTLDPFLDNFGPR